MPDGTLGVTDGSGNPASLKTFIDGGGNHTPYHRLDGTAATDPVPWSLARLHNESVSSALIAAVVRAGAAKIGSIHFTTTTAVFARIYDKGSAPITSDTPLATFSIPVGSTRIDLGPFDVSAGLAVRITSGSGDADAGTFSANLCDVVAEFRS